MFFYYIIALILIAIIYFINEVKKPANFPPGPSWFPLVGNLPELKKLSTSLGGQHLALSDLAKRYNTNVLGLKLGKDYVVTVFSYHLVREVLTSEVYEGRPDNFFLRLRCMGTRRGVTCTDGDLWNIQRNFVTRHLRNLGFGKKSMELMMEVEIKEILSVLRDQGSEVQIGKLLAPAVINILWMLVTGTKISRENSHLNKLLDLLEQRSKAFDMSGGTLSQHPWMRFVFPEKSGYNLICRMNDELKSLFMETIEEHHRSWEEGKSDDLIYSFISEMKQSNGHQISTFTDDQLVMVCLDLFIAGSQTTSNSLDFAILMMILHPDIQSKVHNRIDEAVQNGPFVYSDRHKLAYVEAVLLEVERYCHVTPICGPRRVLKDTTLDGYFLPKETTVLISLYSVHNDEDYWKDPEVFRPERFLNDDGFILPQDRLIPFGLGKRRCLGESLARNCIFLFFVEILRKYEVSLLPGSKMPTGKPLPGITLSPENYRARFTERLLANN